MRAGVVAGVTGYLLWGLYPLYWPLLAPAGAVEILVHRIVWSAVLVLVLLVALGRLRSLLHRISSRRTIGLTGLAAVLMAVNWGVYIWAVNNGHVVDTALGYFINPLMTVAAGVVLLGEQLRLAQRIALGLAALAAVVLLAGQHEFPWVALVLAGSFAGYAIVKKQVGLGAVDGFATETALLAVPALAALVLLGASGGATAFAHGWEHAMLLVLTGAVSAAPLLCFGAAVVRLPLATLGAIQYLAPILQFLTGVLFYREEMPLDRWIGFCLVWAAAVVLVVDGLRTVTPPVAAPSPRAGLPRRGATADGEAR
jgi:chloramphenicol-sensitive protein RarD